MAMADAKVNYNFEEKLLSQDQVLVTNNLGRIAEHLELVSLDGYFGEVREFDDIANGATGMISINAERTINTTQCNLTDTFVLGGLVYFVSGGAGAAGALRAGYITGGTAVGICTVVNNGVSVGFKPYVQRVSGNNVGNISEYDVVADATGGVVITGLVPLGARIYDVTVECKATNGSGTLQLQSNNATPVDITAALVCAVDNVVIRQAILTNNVVDGDGLLLTANGAADRGIMTIYWR